MSAIRTVNVLCIQINVSLQHAQRINWKIVNWMLKGISTFHTILIRRFSMFNKWECVWYGVAFEGSVSLFFPNLCQSKYGHFFAMNRFQIASHFNLTKGFHRFWTIYLVEFLFLFHLKMNQFDRFIFVSLLIFSTVYWFSLVILQRKRKNFTKSSYPFEMKVYFCRTLNILLPKYHHFPHFC